MNRFFSACIAIAISFLAFLEPTPSEILTPSGTFMPSGTFTPSGILTPSKSTSEAASEVVIEGLDLSDPAVLSMRKRAEVIDRLLEERLEIVIPELMRRNGIDMWVVSAREYNEDPVIRTMIPATWIAARRRTILVFFDRGNEGIERLAVARYNIGTSFPSAWNPEEQPDQWARLAEIVAERNPKKIGVSMSVNYGHADGLTATEKEGMFAALGEKYASRVVSAENLAVGWLETRTQSEMEIYPMIVRLARSIIEDGLSELVIQPGVTRTDDVEWWYRERIRDLNLITWFHPSVDIQRKQAGERDGDFSSREEAGVIQRGDLLHVDFGITYLRLNTDTQMHAYVLEQDESEAPADLVKALAVGNRLQDILTGQFATGRTGNQILAAALAQAAKEGIDATIYTHPIGFHGHAAGPTIGMWDKQEGVPGSGDYPMYPMTAYSIELNAAVPIPMWDGQAARIMLEEDALFDGSKVTYIDPRQTELLLIPRQ